MADYQCAKCGGDQGFEVTEAQIPDYQYSNSVVPLTLTAAWASKPDAGFFSSGGERLGVALRAEVCQSCGYVEFYVQDPGLLARFARERLGKVNRLR